MVVDASASKISPRFNSIFVFDLHQRLADDFFVVSCSSSSYLAGARYRTSRFDDDEKNALSFQVGVTGNRRLAAIPPDPFRNIAGIGCDADIPSRRLQDSARGSRWFFCCEFDIVTDEFIAGLLISEVAVRGERNTPSVPHGH